MNCTTGNATVDAVAKMNFTGNIIPSVWFQTILGESGKPNVTACLLLADIVYWYRPTEVRDPETGKFAGYKKKIKADVLQRSYEDLADAFNLSKRQVKDAIVLLENLGVVRRDFRTIKTAAGVRANNVMFLELNPERLQELTYPDDAGEDTAADPSELDRALEKSADPMTEKRHRSDEKTTEVCRKTDTGVAEFRQTNTENTTENTTEITDHIPSVPSSLAEREAFEQIFKDQIRYDWICNKWPEALCIDDWAVQNVVNACVQVACQVYFSNSKYKRISGNEVPLEVVKKQLLLLQPTHICSVVSGILNSGKEIKNKPAYLLASMLNELHTGDVGIVNRMAVDLGPDAFTKGGDAS